MPYQLATPVSVWPTATGAERFDDSLPAFDAVRAGCGGEGARATLCFRPQAGSKKRHAAIAAMGIRSFFKSVMANRKKYKDQNAVTYEDTRIESL